jgi:hypothetical protein
MIRIRCGMSATPPGASSNTRGLTAVILLVATPVIVNAKNGIAAPGAPTSRGWKPS